MIERRNTPLVSVVLPCRNEETSLDSCIASIKNVFKKYQIDGEIIVSDSSSDSSPEIARRHAVTLIKHDEVGYGNAYRNGFTAATGKFIFCADPDGTYDFNEIPTFIETLQQGSDIVMGNRFAGTIEKGAMPLWHRYIGSPLISLLVKLFFKKRIKDINSGMRSFRKESLSVLNLQTTGMEFASEMVVKAIKQNMKITELPINYSIRKGVSKLKTLSDGWRHFRFLLLWSPLYLYFIPGVFFLALGVGSMYWMYFFDATILGIPLVFHSFFISSLLTIVGYQLVFFGLFAKTYAITHLGDTDSRMNVVHRYITIEKASAIGLLFITIGVGVLFSIFKHWLESNFGELNEVKNSLVSLTFIVIGVQTVFSSFMLSMLGVRDK